MRNAIVFIIAIAVAGYAGYATQDWLAQQEAEALAEQKRAAIKTDQSVIDQPRPEFAIADTDGRLRNISEWDGKFILLNFWATWCPPCKKEIPHFIELQQEYGDAGLQIVGVAMDNAADVSAFAMEMDINYPLMIGEQDAIELARRYGNDFGALPYTVIIDSEAIIRSTFAGELSKDQAIELLQQAGMAI